MTTIIVDRKLRIMASDKQMTASDGHKMHHRKIRRVTHNKRKYLIGICGDADAGEAFIHWWNTPEDSDDRHYPKNADFHALALSEEGGLVWYGPSGYPVEITDRFHGIGSGSDFALGALHAGADIKQAIKIASKLDANSGFGIQVEGFKDAKTD